MTLQPLPYQRHSGTSRAGAEAARQYAQTQEAVVLEFLRGEGDHGATDGEIADEFSGKESSWRRARCVLTERGLVSFRPLPLKVPHVHNESRAYCSGCVETRKSASGVSCAVWFAKGENAK